MRSVLMLASATCLAVLPVDAQEWGAEQQELIDHVQRCWETWQGGFDKWQEACPHAENRVWWFTAENVPKTEWSNFAEAAQYFMDSEQTLFFEHRPLHVAMHGDVAIYAYWVMYAARDGSGQVANYMQKRLEAFRKVGGRWMFIAGMGVPEN
jgi:ketosteroid isomerase-like protein